MRILLVAGLICPILISGPALAQSQGLQVIGFSDTLKLRLDGRAVSLEAGSAGLTIPAGARATVLAGDATLLAEGSIISIKAGDSFLYAAADGPGQILVSAGEVLITPPDGKSYSVMAGEFAPLSGLPAVPGAGPEPPAALPSIPPAPPRAPPAAPPSTGAEVPEFDPLNALATGLQKLSSMQRPKLSLMIEVRPHYKLSQSYDSNIYAVPADRPNGVKTGGGVVGSWITTNNLGSRFILPFSKRSKLSLLYDAQFVNYATQGDANNAFNQNVRGEFKHEGMRGTALKLWMHYLNTEDPAFSQLVTRERRFQNTTGIEYDYARSRRFFIRPRATHTMHKYLSKTLAAQLNRFEAQAGADIGMRIRPKTRLFASYHRQIIHYSAGRLNHSKSHIAGLGAEGELAPRLTGRVDAGMTFRRYDVPLTVGDRELNTLTTQLDLKYKPGRRFESRFTLSRAVTETTFALNRHYVANRAALEFTHYYRKLSLSVDGSFQTDRYPETTTVGTVTGNRRDDIYTGSLRTQYKLRQWLALGLFYSRAQRHSIFKNQFNYTINKTGLTLEMAF